MQSVSSYLNGVISERPQALLSSCFRLFKRASFFVAAVTVAVTVAVISGCGTSAEEASPRTLEALSIVGGDVHVLGGMSALDGVDEFTSALDRETDLESNDQLRQILEEMGLNMEEAAVDIYFGLRDLDDSDFAGAVVYAPITEDHLEELSSHMPELQSAAGLGHDHSTIFQEAPDASSQQGLFLSLIEDGLVLVSSSESELEAMHSRAHSDSPNYVGLSELVSTASNRQVWLATDHADKWTQAIPDLTDGDLPSEIVLLTKAVSGIALAADLDAASYDAPTMSGIVYLAPKEGVSAEDVKDLAEGLVAFVKLNDEAGQWAELVDRIEISRAGDIVEIAFRVSTSDIRPIAENF